MRKMLALRFAAGCLSMACVAASAQEVVHAVDGTVRTVNQKSRTLYVKTGDGSEGMFKELPDSKFSESLDKALREETVPADKFAANGDAVVLFFEGDDTTRVAVAVLDLGKVTLQEVDGTVVRFDKHAHTLTLRAASGTDTQYPIDPKAVADMPTGAVEGSKFEVSKGQHVHIATTPQKGGPTAVFLAVAL